MKKIRILFICKYNRFRSRVAEAYFKKINKNKSIIAESAGLFQGWYPLDKNQLNTAKKFGLNIDGKPRGLSTILLKKQDRIIIISDDIPATLFDQVMIADDTPQLFNKEGRVDVWKIKDVVFSQDKKSVDRIIRSVIKRVNKLVKQLNDK